MRKPKLAMTLALALACAAAAAGQDSGKKDSPKKKDPAADINTPRADARRLTFATSEATWSSLDVSPDGRTIVFDLLGEIYAVPIGGGAACMMSP